ncbi:hydrophobic surface binding protein [Mycena floridula]|nr:hydrophobic surface binding protein [Mycena floridula]
MRFTVLLSLVVAALAVPTKRDVATVKSDITTISTQTTSLDGLVNAYPNTGGTLLAALTIHTSATTLLATVKKSTADTLATPPFSEADGAAILQSVEAIEPTISDVLTVIVAKKPAFQALPLGGVPALILQDLTFLSGNVTAFANALIADSPADLVAEATTLKNNIIAAFAVAIAAYSS